MTDASGWNPGKIRNQLSSSLFPASEAKKPGPGLHIMLAEDNPADVLLVGEALDLYQLSAVLHILNDGEKAFEFIQNTERDEFAPCPALALLDLNLPRKSGLEILARIRQSPKFKDIPVVIITSSDSPKDREETARLGANRYFRKPSGYEDFLKLGEVVQEVIEEQQARSS